MKTHWELKGRETLSVNSLPSRLKKCYSHIISIPSPPNLLE